MKKSFFLYIIFFLQLGVIAGQEVVITVDNPTCYNVYFEGNQRINKNSSGRVKLFIDSRTLTRGFNVWYEIPLSRTVPLYIIGDHRTIRENQTSLIIDEPRFTENHGRYITITNNSGNAISFRSGGIVVPLMEQAGIPSRENLLIPTNKREFSPGETAVFDISMDSGNESHIIYDSRRNIPLVIPQPLKRNHLYTFEYSAGNITLTDSRPLHRAGESGWVREIPDAAAVMQVVSARNDIFLFAPGDNGLFRYDFDSAGNQKDKINCADIYDITYVAHVNNDFFVTGYNIDSAELKKLPIARIHGVDGTIRRSLLPSSRTSEYNSAFFNTAAHKDNIWLAAGGAKGVNDAGDYRAYVRQIRDNGSALTAGWEIGGRNFNDKCGEVLCAEYDAVNNRWLLSGINNEYEMGQLVKGSYLAIIGDDGRVRSIDNSFRGMIFNKILCDSNGNYFLIGEEQKGNDTFAMIFKYNSSGSLLWQLSDPISSNSYYQSALLDIENNQIIAGGTMRAEDEYGTGGTPFIEARDIESGALLWREEYTGSLFRNVSLVTAIISAPDYGYALTLCGIADGYTHKPFVIARVNERGKIINY